METEMFDNDENESHQEEIGFKSNRNKGDHYKPWHKPRKQWVRECQWWAHLEKMLERYSQLFLNETKVRYFGLPGEDLLDVDYISKKMASSKELSDKKLLIHGILSSPIEQQKANSRLTELLDRKNVDYASKVEHFNFNSLSSVSAVLWGKMKGIAPYHLINLDFCEKIFQDQTISAVHNLLDYQFKSLPEKPWIFCLTTKVDAKGDNLDVLKRLDKCLHSIESDELSIYRLDKHFKPVFDAIQEKLSIDKTVDNIALFTDIYIVGFVIWLILKARNKDISFKLKSSAKYGVADDKGVPDMYSFVFQFKGEIIIEPDVQGVAILKGLHQNIQYDKDPREIVIERLFNSVNVDHTLNDDKIKFQKYIDDTKEALVSCGYDVNNYEEKLCPEF